MPTTEQEAQDYFHALSHQFFMKYGTRVWWGRLEREDHLEWQRRLDIWFSFD